MALRVMHFADLEAAHDDPERVGRLAGLVAERRHEETVVTGGGDDTGPSVLSVVTDGRQALDVFRAVGLDAETFGNHDFDHGVDALRDLVADSPQPWVCANATLDGNRFAAGEGAVPWTVVAAGERAVGVVGVAHRETADINPSADPVVFTDPVEAVVDAVDEVRAAGVDSVLVVSHRGDNTDIARAVDVDAVLGGHDHDPGVEWVGDTPVCRPGGTGRFLLEVEFGTDPPTVTHHAVEDAPIDEAAATAVRDRMAATGLSDVVASVDDPVVCDMQACKRGESRLGNLVADAYRWATGADVALLSGGGFRRRDPLAGDVTALDLVSVVPYDEALVSLEVDGSTLEAALGELALCSAPDDLPAWHFGHVSGASVVWDDDAGALRSASVDGEPVDPGASYRLATTDFFVAATDLFPSLGPEAVVDRHGSQYEALVEYARETGINPRVDGRVSRPALDENAVPARNWPHSP